MVGAHKPDAALPVRVYSAYAPSPGFLSGVTRAAAELWCSRGVLWRLFRRDLTAQYRQKVLGYVWALLHPLLAVVSFVFLYHAGILRPGDVGAPYFLYVFIGTSLWGFFISVTQSVSDGLRTHGDLLLRTGMPRISLAVSGLAGVAFALLLQLVLLGVVLACCGVVPAWSGLLYPLLLVPLALVGLGLGLCLAVAGAVARDVPAVATTCLNVLMYLTPVVYAAQFDHAGLQAIVAWNPMTYLIDSPRSLLLTGSVAHASGFLLATGFSVAVLIVSLRGFYVLQDLSVERL